MAHSAGRTEDQPTKLRPSSRTDVSPPWTATINQGPHSAAQWNETVSTGMA